MIITSSMGGSRVEDWRWGTCPQMLVGLPNFYSAEAGGVM